LKNDNNENAATTMAAHSSEGLPTTLADPTAKAAPSQRNATQRSNNTVRKQKYRLDEVPFPLFDPQQR